MRTFIDWVARHTGGTSAAARRGDCASDREALAALGAARRNDGASAARLHAHQKAVRARAFHFGRLVCPFRCHCCSLVAAGAAACPRGADARRIVTARGAVSSAPQDSHGAAQKSAVLDATRLATVKRASKRPRAGQSRRQKVDNPGDSAVDNCLVRCMTNCLVPQRGMPSGCKCTLS